MRDSQLLIDIGYRICQRRKELHLTQEQVAEQMDVSIQMISNLELGKKAIRPENLIKICQVLNVSADYILMGQGTLQELSHIAQKFRTLSTEHQRIIEMLIDSL